MDGQLWVQEVFRTIQGEGPLAGRPAVFIRLAGCNLACNFCDTEFESGQMLAWEEIARVARRNIVVGEPEPLFVITGGEPLRQDIRSLVNALLLIGEVQIETAGTLWLEGLHPAVQLVVSPKTGKLHPDILRRAKYFKYIIRSGEVDSDDGLPSVMPTGIPGKVARAPMGAIVYVQPCDDHNSHSNQNNLAATKNIALHFGYRISLQQHKILEVA